VNAQQDFRSQRIPAFTPEQADAIVSLIAHVHGNLDAKEDCRKLKPDVDHLKVEGSNATDP
jgi:hypothetical protein